ncbi:MAG: acetyl-CoA carboxylase biotin carboxylase subunit [Candidatus Neomarinimicrobiota bacterium]|nr:MAG: acetyl-CoA carboxylase biotin carboxylase subunit [Candidatus Neomarinimicrobiota bacterium]
MYKKILIANRGEIALRIIRACHELGIKTVAVYSTADEYSLHVKFSDEAVCIGPPPSNESYLNIPRILAAAEITHADAIHPGYGFLAENAEFSRICQDNGFVFIGPTAEIINAMGNKSEAKKIMKSCGVPVIPGSNDVLNDVGEARNLAEKVGYPVMIKASAGGGGRGIRLVKSQDELESAFGSAQAEAKSAFNNGDLYLEKFVENSRHIEVQILADSSGNTVHLGERECTIQRRHQKLIEESPSVIVDSDLRKKLGTSAINAAKTVKYVGVGTVEFLVDKNLNYYFMEMNTRIQVEHPVTEMVSGVDLIKQQIRMHVGKSFPSFLEKFQLRGHAIECRINAEDPANDFVPSPMEITSFHMPGGKGVRVDSHAYAGYQIPTYYDSMIGKLIVFSSSRERAIIRMERALEECIIEGPKTTIPFHQAIMRDEQFISGNFDTSFLDNFHYSVAD